MYSFVNLFMNIPPSKVGKLHDPDSTAQTNTREMLIDMCILMLLTREQGMGGIQKYLFNYFTIKYYDINYAFFNFKIKRCFSFCLEASV